MDWFQSFYTTEAMINKGYKVRKPLWERVSGQGAVNVKFGEPYCYADAYKLYTEEKKEYETNIAEEEDPVEKAEYERDYKPAPPLDPATWSFRYGSNEEYEEVYQVEKFDRTTLWRILVAHSEDADVLIKKHANATTEQLVALVKQEIGREASYAEMALECHPIMELCSGILVLNNWHWLSDADLLKMVEAHGWYWLDRDYAVKQLLREQVKMFEEMLVKGYTGEDCRGYNSIRARLRDNKRTLGLSLLPTDEPQARKRQKA